MVNDDIEEHDDEEQPVPGPEPMDRVGFTIASDPPKRERPQRRSWWADTFAEARQHQGQWRLVVMVFAKSTAHQLASDVRNSYKRAPEKMRLRGVGAGELWEAECAPAPCLCGEECTCAEPFWLWVKFIGNA